MRLCIAYAVYASNCELQREIRIKLYGGDGDGDCLLVQMHVFYSIYLLIYLPIVDYVILYYINHKNKTQ